MDHPNDLTLLEMFQKRLKNTRNVRQHTQMINMLLNKTTKQINNWISKILTSRDRRQQETSKRLSVSYVSNNYDTELNAVGGQKNTDSVFFSVHLASRRRLS